MKNFYKILCLLLSLFVSTLSYAQFTVSGTVTDELGNPLMGVTAVIKGSTTGTVTDLDGNFSIDIPGNEGVLVFEYLGYGSKEVSVMAANSRITLSLQEEATALEQVVVTAQKRAQTLQEVPMAISTISEVQMQKSGVFRPNDLAIIVPNLNVTSPHAAGAPNFSMRGISVGNEFNYNQASPIGVYLDEIYLGARFTHGANLYDVRRVEVLRGPQGTLYGRNTTGGAINFITRSPSLLGGVSGYATLGYGNRNRIMAEAAVDATISDNFGIRAAGKFLRSDDFMENVNPNGEDGQGTNGLAGRLSLRYHTDKVDITGRFYTSNEEPGGTGVISLGSGPDGRNTITGGCRCDANEGRPLTDRQFDSSTTGDVDIESKGANLTAKIALSDNLELTSITAWDKGHIAQPEFDWSASAARIGHGDWIANNEQAQQDMRLSYDFGRGNIIFGGYYGWDETNVDNTYFFYEDAPPVDALVALQVMPTTVYQNYDQVRKSLAFYGHGSFDLSDRFTLTAGLRWTKDNFSYQNGFAWLEVTIPTHVAQLYNNLEIVPLADHPLLGATLGPAAGATLPQQTIPGPGALGVPPDFNSPLPDQDGESSKVTGTVILDYKLTESVMAYGSFSRGYRAGAFNGNGYLAPEQVSFVDPETIDAWELGIKSRFLDNRMQLNAAAFLYDYTNNQFQNIVGIVSFLENAGKSEIKGFETELAALLTDKIKLNLNIGYQDAQYKELSLLSPTDVNGALNGDANGNGLIDILLGETGESLPIVLNGNSMMNAPKWNLSIGTDITLLKTANSNKLSLIPSANYTSHQFLSPFNDLAGNHRLVQDGYWLANGQLVWEAEKYTVRLWGQNLFDETYFVYGIDIRSGFDVDYLVRGAPVTVGVDVSFRF